MIWEMYCPDLFVKGHRFHFIVRGASSAALASLSPTNGAVTTVWHFETLALQTRRYRHLMAVHYESRCIGSRKFTDKIQFDSQLGFTTLRVSFK